MTHVHMKLRFDQRNKFPHDFMISIRKLFLCEMATCHFPAMSFWEKSSWQNLDLQVQYVSLWDFCARINYYTHCHQLQKQDRDVACQGSQLALRPLEKKMSSFLLMQWTEPEDKAHYEGLFLAANSHKCNNSRGRHWPHSEMSQFSTLLSEL